jgi:hypothetical protein
MSSSKPHTGNHSFPTVNPITPEDVLSETDAGDDMQRRVHYQVGYAALYCLRMLEPNSDLQEVYCEQHEDVLLKRQDHLFVGVQVKTRADGMEPLKASDAAVLNALERFVRLEILFPGQFERYILVSNGGLWCQKRNSANLPYLLDLAREHIAADSADCAPLKRISDKLTKMLLKKKADGKQLALDRATANSLVRQVLAKTHVEEEAPGLNDIESRLIKVLQRLPEFQGCRYDELKRAINGLIQASSEAGSLSANDALTAYVALSPDPSNARIQVVVDGKRLTREKILSLLRSHLQPRALLSPHQPITIAELPSGMRRMELKMSAGGLSASNIDLAKDLRSSTETLLLEWLHKFGSVQANKQYEHLYVLVRSECQEAYDQQLTTVRPFGDSLLKEIRQRLRARFQIEPEKLWGCHYEHLMGMASLLTEECKLWWSQVFDLPKDISL